SLKRAHKLEPQNPELHTCFVRFLQHRQEKFGSDAESPVAQVINLELNNLLTNTDPTQLNEDFLNKHQESIAHRLQAARSMVLLDSIQRERAINIGTSLESHLQGRILPNLVKVLEWLEGNEFKGSCDEISLYKSQCNAVIPHALAFRAPSAIIPNSDTNSTMNHNHTDAPDS
ncbi:unnamed protein product, partial [Meganyctiphanes norvegica]